MTLPPDTGYHMTDKRTIMRQAFYRKFEERIEGVYENIGIEGHLSPSSPDLKAFIHREVLADSGLNEGSFDDETDSSGLGLDLLQATQIRASLVRRINLNRSTLGLNVVSTILMLSL